MSWAKGQELQGGKYIIEEVLGQGGFGTTYKAVHLLLNDSVVIKTPNEHLKHDPDYQKYVDKFKQEVQILERFSVYARPHIVGVRDFFQEGEIQCLVMNFIRGENLFQLVKRRGAIPEVEAVEYIRQIGKALAVVHQAGLVHRDAHPGNIIVRDNGNAILIDFGIAKELVPSTQSSTGKAGNEGFAPYEQMYVGSREPNVDVYCLAATLYYVLTAKKPVTGLSRKLDNMRLIPPKRIISDISNSVNRAILKGMALEPKDRPQSMKKWLELLDLSEKKSRWYVAWQRQTRTIPWVILVLLLGCYSVVGILVHQVEVVAVVVAVAVAVAGAWDLNWVWGVVWVVVWVVVSVVAVARDWAWGVVWVVVWVLAVACAGAVAGDKLFESFSRFHTVLILLSTSLLGLGLGWLVRLLFLQIFTN